MLKEKLQEELNRYNAINKYGKKVTQITTKAIRHGINFGNSDQLISNASVVEKGQIKTKISPKLKAKN